MKHDNAKQVITEPKMWLPAVEKNGVLIPVSKRQMGYEQAQNFLKRKYRRAHLSGETNTILLNLNRRELTT